MALCRRGHRSISGSGRADSAGWLTRPGARSVQSPLWPRHPSSPTTAKRAPGRL